MSNLNTVEIKAFVPAKDYALSKQFYIDIGFEIPWSDDSLAYVRYQDCSFFLQNFYIQEHADNFLMHIVVEDADAWRNMILERGIIEKYGVFLGEISDKSWNMRDFQFKDPTGILWQIGHNLPVGD